MRSMRLMVRGLGVLAAIGLLALAGIYVASEVKLRRTVEAPLVPFNARPTDVGEGRRLAVLVGCWAGCHGKQGEGRTQRVPGIYSITAPTLAEVLPQYDDAELVRLIRYGVKRDGQSALSMSSDTFFALSDADLANIIGHLRAQPQHPPVPRERKLTLRGRLGLILGRLRTSAEQVDRAMPRWGELPRSNAFERGRYLASVTCAECHGLDFQGEAVIRSPSLALVGGYTPERFRHLLRTGETPYGRELGLMRWVARNAFFEFTDAEIADLYAFLVKRFTPTEPAASEPDPAGSKN